MHVFLFSPDVHVCVRHTGSSPRPPDPSRGEGAVSHLWEAAVCRLHHRPHEGPQPVAAPRLSPLQPQWVAATSQQTFCELTRVRRLLPIHPKQHHREQKAHHMCVCAPERKLSVLLWFGVFSSARDQLYVTVYWSLSAVSSSYSCCFVLKVLHQQTNRRLLLWSSY